MTVSVEASALVRADLADAHWLLEQVVDGLTDGQLHSGEIVVLRGLQGLQGLP